MRDKQVLTLGELVTDLAPLCPYFLRSLTLASRVIIRPFSALAAGPDRPGATLRKAMADGTGLTGNTTAQDANLIS